MRHLFLGLAAAASLLSGSVAAGGAQAAPSPQIIFGVDRAGDRPTLDRVQFVYGGRNFCWYDSAWRGAGFYWCGYAWRRGFGWGGGRGWHGWRGGGGFHHGGRIVIHGGHHWNHHRWSGHHWSGHRGFHHHVGHRHVRR